MLKTSATTLLLARNLKQLERLTIQLRVGGAVSLRVIDCNEPQIHGMVRCSAAGAAGSAADLLGDDRQLQAALDMPSMHEPYQNIAPLTGDSITEIFDHDLGRLDQLPARLFLAASADGAAGLFLQRLPTDELLLRFFGEETDRLFAARAVAYNGPLGAPRRKTSNAAERASA